MSQIADNATKSWVLAIASLGSLMAVLDAMVVATALTRIQTDLGVSIETLEWTMNAYNLSFAVLLLTGAALGDRFGRRRMFVAGLALFVAASVACALAKTAGWLIAARAIQGAGAALIMPLAMALLSAAYPPEERAKALGMFGGITGLALIVGPILGGVIAEGAPWQWIFWINLPIGLILIPFALRRIPESFGPATAIDGVGVVIVTGAAFGLVWALMRGNESGWKSFEVALASGAGLLLALGFVFWEIRTSHPMVPMRFFRSQAFSSGIAASVLFYAGMYGVVFFLPQYFQSAQGHGPLAAGLRLLPWTATLFVVAPIAGRLVNSIGEKSLIVVGLGMQAVGFAWIGLIAEPELPYFKLVLPLIIAGAGVSMAMPAAQNAVLNSVAKPEIGKASGIFNMFRFLGGVSGIALDVAVFSAVGGLAAVQSFSTGFATAIGASALLSLGGAIAGLWQPRRVKALLDSASVKA